MPVYLGIDLGTTGLKSLLVREDGRIAGAGYREYPISIPAPGHAEQEPAHWWRALKESLAEAMAVSGVRKEEIAGIGLSGQMHGMVLTDAAGAALCPAVIWCDQRSAGEAAMIRDRIGTETLGKWTQNPVSVGFQICSLLWMRAHRPDIYEKTRHVLLPKDYIRFLLTDEYGTEPTDACSTLFYDCARRAWSREMTAAFDIDASLLPDADHLPTEVHAGLTRRAAEELGLLAGIPVVYGGGDQPMQAIGNGILSPGEASVTLGTGGQIFVPMSAPGYDPLLRTHTFCHAEDQTWYVMGAILNCCLAQNWFFDKVLLTHDFREMHALAGSVEPGCGGLYFLPYLTGERTPHLNPEAKGMFFGLTLQHDRATMVRAVVEGISHALTDAMDCILGLTPAPAIDRLILSGGGARSPLWRQMIADMLNRPIHTTRMTEEAGTGAAICAMVGAGEYAGLREACSAIVKYDEEITLPDPDCVALYRERHKTFRALYEANRPLFGGGQG